MAQCRFQHCQSHCVVLLGKTVYSHHASVPTPPSFINGYAQDEKTIIGKLKHGGNTLLHSGNTGTKLNVCFR